MRIALFLDKLLLTTPFTKEITWLKAFSKKESVFSPQRASNHEEQILAHNSSNDEEQILAHNSSNDEEQILAHNSSNHARGANSSTQQLSDTDQARGIRNLTSLPKYGV